MQGCDADIGRLITTCGRCRVCQPPASSTRRQTWGVTQAGKAARAGKKKHAAGLAALHLCSQVCTACTVSACARLRMPTVAGCTARSCTLRLSFAVLAACPVFEYNMTVAVASKTCAGVSPSAGRSTLLVLLCCVALSGRRPKQFSQARHAV